MSLIDNWNAFTPTGKAMAVITIVGGILTVLTQITPAVSALDDNGFPVMATRAFVREYTGQANTAIGRLTAKQNDMQVDTLNGKIEAARASRNAIEIAALKYDDEGKTKAGQEIRRLDDLIAALSEQLRAIQGVRRPN
jgi:hypothetical protein